jgi:hypothetical protein
VLRPLLIAGQRQSHLQKNVGKPRTANNNKNNEHIQLMHEAAQMVFNEEEHSSEKSLQETVKLKKQVEEVVQNLKTVEEKTVVQSRTIIEQQKQVVKEVLKESPAVWQEEKGAAFIRQEVQKSIEDQIDESVSQIAGRVYRNLERRLKIERGRRGLG